MRTIDPALPRVGTDVMTLRVVMRTIDPALPRIGTDFMTLRVAMCTIDPAPPRIGTDFMTPALRPAIFLLDSAAGSKATDKEVCNAWL
jgi:hypothetical protein